MSKPTHIRKVLFGADEQAPYYHKPTWNIHLEFARDWKPTDYVAIGDRWDLRSLSKYETDVEKADLRLKFKDDLNAGIQLSEELHSALPRKCHKVFHKGNHEARCERRVGEDFTLKDLVQIDDYLEKSGYEVIPHGHFSNIGKIYTHHGDCYGGQHHAKQYALKTGKNVVYGHYHEFQSYWVHHLDQPHMAQSIGMLGDRKKLEFYVKGRPTNWANGFAYAYILPDGSFSLYPVVVANGKAIIEGKEYRG